MGVEDTTPQRVTVGVLVLLAVLLVVGVVSFGRSIADEGPGQDACDAARASADAVAEREDSVEDELEYRRLDARAERICAGG